VILPVEVAQRADEIGRRLEVVASRILAAGGQVGEGGVQIVAVAKGHPAAAVIAASTVGLRLFGENYAQEFTAKASEIRAAAEGPAGLAGFELDHVTWHFIGQLQRNKVRSVAPLAAVIQSVDRASVLEELARRSPGHQIFLQVDLAQAVGGSSDGRGGTALDDAPGLAEMARAAGLTLIGVMGVAPAGDVLRAGRAFRALRGLADRLEVPHCSMGMSDDLEVAVAEGTTMLRLGSALMGARTVLRA
jgi:uncharacterized pyridoxal phosphate-containing UPF0001 family protein